MSPINLFSDRQTGRSSAQGVPGPVPLVDPAAMLQSFRPGHASRPDRLRRTLFPHSRGAPSSVTGQAGASASGLTPAAAALWQGWASVRARLPCQPGPWIPGRIEGRRGLARGWCGRGLTGRKGRHSGSVRGARSAPLMEPERRQALTPVKGPRGAPGTRSLAQPRRGKKGHAQGNRCAASGPGERSGPLLGPEPARQGGVRKP